uniref:Uncharacterized protein n=1 Tax=Rhizophora mucronata TaxID=61149 RepID=A0A2P2ND76_RHIMU
MGWAPNHHGNYADGSRTGGSRKKEFVLLKGIGLRSPLQGLIRARCNAPRGPST